MRLYYDPATGAAKFTVTLDPASQISPPGPFIEVADDFAEILAGLSVIDGQIVRTDDAPVRQERKDLVMAERNRRMRGTFPFNGHVFDCDEGSLQRITGAAALAGFAIGQGAQPGNLFWHGGSTPFAWISAANVIVTMDAHTTFAFGQAAAANETAHVFAARALKDMDPIPENFTDDQWWP